MSVCVMNAGWKHGEKGRGTVLGASSVPLLLILLRLLLAVYRIVRYKIASAQRIGLLQPRYHHHHRNRLD